MKGAILVVDDEKGQREILKTILETEGYDVATATGGLDALQKVQKSRFDLVITDLMMPGMDGAALLGNIRKERPSTSVIMITAHGSIDSAVETIRKGAFDYLTKPIDREKLIIVVGKAVEKAALLNENIQLREQLEEKYRPEGIIGNDGKMREIFRMIKKVSGSSATVLIYGESGTGKELIARAIHYSSPRSANPFVAINCAAMPENLLETELFGYEKGAFTGAYAPTAGLFETAHNGTILLDEIGDMSFPLQAKLLRVLQEKEIRRVGGNKNTPVNVRIIAATNKDLQSEINQGRFREDLFYRLNVITLKLPALRDRKTDIPELAGHFVQKAARAFDKKMRGLTEEAINLLTNYVWPGNVRQLESVIERAVVLSETDMIGVENLPLEITAKPITLGNIDFELPENGISFEEFEKEIIVKAMEKSSGVLGKAATLLGMSYRTLQYRLNKFGIAKETFTAPKGASSKPKSLQKE